MNKKEEIKKGEYLSYLLRRELVEAGIPHTEQGWVSVEFLLNKLQWAKNQLNQIVENNKKRRYEYTPTKEFIRACQGHSIEVSLNLPVSSPPEFFYYGTAFCNLKSILGQGLLKGNRHAVHLTEDLQTGSLLHI